MVLVSCQFCFAAGCLPGKGGGSAGGQGSEGIQTLIK